MFFQVDTEQCKYTKGKKDPLSLLTFKICPVTTNRKNV